MRSAIGRLAVVAVCVGGFLAVAAPPAAAATINIGNFVWSDLDADGVQDGAEPGMPGITVQLWNSAKSSMLTQTSTNASGQYTLVAPGPGSYRVRVVLPDADNAFTVKDAAAAIDQTDSDINPTGADIGFTSTFSLASNVVSIATIDAGILGSVVGDRVWQDTDGDGIQDAAEPGLPNTTVHLLTSGGAEVASTTTNGSGEYHLSAPDGNYRLQFDAPGGRVRTDADVGADTADSDVIDALGRTAVFTTNGSYRTDIDAGFVTPINVGNLVWADDDGDGIKDSGEPGLAGVTVQLWNSTKTQMLNQTSTNGSGTYGLVAPGPGSYRVRAVLFENTNQFSPKDQGANDQTDSDVNASGSDLGFTDVFALASNVVSIATYDIGIQTSVIGDKVWRDTDGDGIQDASEPGLPGVGVHLLNSGGTELASTTTDSGGAYRFDPAPGSYRIKADTPVGMAPTDLDAGLFDINDSDIGSNGTTATFTLGGLPKRDVDAGFVYLANLGNFVWADVDGDGVQDGGEPGLAGITVQVWNSTKSQLLDSDVTSATGSYSVGVPGPGNYRVRAVLPDGGASFSPKDQGANDLTDSDVNPSGADTGFTDVITVASNVVSISTFDIGIELAVPSAPNSVSAVARKQAADVSWAPPTTGNPVTSYTVTASPGGATCTTSATSCTVAGLAPGVSTTFRVQATSVFGPGALSAPSNAVVPYSGVGFHPVTPIRMLDSRNGVGFSGGVGAGATQSFAVAGAGTIPATATGIVMNLTVTEGTDASFVNVFPAGGTNPATASLLFAPGQTVPNLVTVGIGAAGKVSVFNQRGSVQVIGDVVGYFDDGMVDGDLFEAITPERVLDSRGATGGWAGESLGDGEFRDLDLSSSAGVPATATAVVMNVTVTGGTLSSFLQAFPSGVAQPVTANLLFAPGQTVPNLVTVGVGADERITFFNQRGSVHVVVDVVGYFDPGGAGRFHPITPTRALDSRGSTGGWNDTPLAGGTPKALVVSPSVFAPAGSTGIVANVTVTGGSSSSFLSISPTPAALPVTTANLLFAPGQTVSNAVMVGLGGGSIDVFNQQGSVDVIVDVGGFYAPL